MLPRRPALGLPPSLADRGSPRKERDCGRRCSPPLVELAWAFRANRDVAVRRLSAFAVRRPLSFMDAASRHQRPLADGVIDQRCECDRPARWVRDDDVLFCDDCREEDKSGLAWHRIRRRWRVVGGYDGARHALFVRGPWLDPGGSTPVEVVSLDDAIERLLASPTLLNQVRALMTIDDRAGAEAAIREAL